MIIPPQILFEGALHAATETLRPFLSTAPAEVEGTFIAGSLGDGTDVYFKWKTPAHEEQGYLFIYLLFYYLIYLIMI